MAFEYRKDLAVPPEPKSTGVLLFAGIWRGNLIRVTAPSWTGGSPKNRLFFAIAK
jgi:hypothetical protein